MKRTLEIQAVESAQIKTDIPAFKIGDTLNIHTRIIEGEKERIQVAIEIVERWVFVRMPQPLAQVLEVLEI